MATDPSTTTSPIRREPGEHDLGAAAYAIKSTRAAASPGGEDKAARDEREWQRSQLPQEIRDLVLDDQLRRNDICWSVFSD